MNGKLIIEFIMRREAILVAFVVAAVTTAYVDSVSEESWLRFGLAIFAFPVLAWFTHKRQLFVTWTTILLLLLIGSGYLYDSFSGLAGQGTGSWLVDFIKVSAGVYLTWGALIIHRERHAGE